MKKKGSPLWSTVGIASVVSMPLKQVAEQLELQSLEEGLPEEEAERRLLLVRKRREKALKKGVGRHLVLWRDYYSDTSPLPALKYRVKRGGIVREGVDFREIVPGDVVIVEKGQRCPGDARVVVSDGAVVDDSMISGRREVPLESEDGGFNLFDANNRAFAGTHLWEGTAELLIVAVYPGCLFESPYSYDPPNIGFSSLSKTELKLAQKLLRDELPVRGLWLDRIQNLVVLWKLANFLVIPDRIFQATAPHVIDGLVELGLNIISVSKNTEMTGTDWTPIWEQLRKLSVRERGGGSVTQFELGNSEHEYPGTCSRLLVELPAARFILCGARELLTANTEWALDNGMGLILAETDDTPQVMDWTKGKGGLFLVSYVLEALLDVKRFLAALKSK